jgi:hypothetical protein
MQQRLHYADINDVFYSVEYTTILYSTLLYIQCIFKLREQKIRAILGPVGRLLAPRRLGMATVLNGIWYGH